MRVGGKARYFAVAKNIRQLNVALSFAARQSVPIFILGGGSNIVVSDSGFHGLVLKPDMKGVLIKEHSDSFIVSAAAGENWDSLVETVSSKNIFGLENLSAIPGTVGAAPVQNIGAYGAELKNVVLSIEALDAKTGKTVSLSCDECAFAYRDSIFKHDEGKHFIITKVVLQLSKNGILQTKYKDVEQYIAENNLPEKELTPARMRQIITHIRERKLPDVQKIGTAGSFFKNPVISREKFLALAHVYRELPGHDIGNGLIKISAGWIIEKVCKKKGFKKDSVGVYEKQALVLVNYGGSNARAVKQFAEEIRSDIKRHTGILVEFEISFVGQFDENQ